MISPPVSGSALLGGQFSFAETPALRERGVGQRLRATLSKKENRQFEA